MHLVYAFIFALLAAAGNALFVFGQRRAEVTDNPAMFMLWAIAFCTFLFVLTFLFVPKVQLLDFALRNRVYIMISGAGYYLTFIGFAYLFTRFGASYYALYAVLSIITTSVIVGLILLKETFNIFYGLAIVTAILTIVFFALAQGKA